MPCINLSILYCRFSCFHLEYQTLTGNSLTNLLIKHYRTQVHCTITYFCVQMQNYFQFVSEQENMQCFSLQALFQLHTLIFGLDVLGNPISVVRGVVVGAVDLFYEPIKVLPCFLALAVSIALHFFLHMCREVSLDLKSFLKGWALALGASLGQELLVSA